jgi:CubicO group peptidase (beta-lactamase class C family)
MKTITSFLCLCFAISLTAQTPLETFLKDSLDFYVNQGLKQWDIPGVSVCVVKDGKVLVEKGYGVREKGKPEPADQHTLFMIGSNSKAFTGTAMALLESEGKCSLDDKVQRWLPSFKMKDPWVGSHLSLTDILSHRMGMETFQGDFTYWTTDLTSDQVIEKFGMFTPQFEFRTKWGYTNAGFVIAGACIKAISGQTWADFIKSRIFQPLGMQRTVALSADLPKAENAAHPHTRVADQMTAIPFPMIDNLAPAGSIASSAHDMGLWAMMQLANGKQNGLQVIPAEAIARIRQPQSIVGRSSRYSHYELYGMGWDLQDYNGKELVSHTGGVNGFVSSVTLVPEDKLGVIVLTNSDVNSFYYALNRVIVHAALGLPYRDIMPRVLNGFNRNQQETAAQTKTIRDTIAMHIPLALPLPSFVGRYENEVYGFLNLQIRNGNMLEMTMQHHPRVTAALAGMGGNRFYCTYSDPVLGAKVLAFKIDNGKVVSFTLRVADDVEFTTYEFVKKG